MRRENTSDGSVAIHWGPGGDEDALKEQFEVLWDALLRYQQANEKYHDNWKRMGWRGMLVRVRERAERLWDDLWDQPPVEGTELALSEPPIDVDDAIDLINFAAFLIRAVRDGNRDGSWWTGDDDVDIDPFPPPRATIRDAMSPSSGAGIAHVRVPTPYDIMDAKRGSPMDDLLIAELNAELQSWGYHGVIEVEDGRVLHYKETLR